MQRIVSTLKPFLLSVSIIVLSVTPFRLVSLVVVIVLLARALRPSTSRLINGAIAYMVFVVIVMLVAAVMWLIRLPMELPFAVIVSLAIVFTLRRSGVAVPQQRVAIPRGTVVLAASLALVAIGMALLPVLRQPDGATAIRHAMNNRDEVNHVAMLLANEAADGYVYAAPDQTRAYFAPKLSGYPQGWHTNGALLFDAVRALPGKYTMTTTATIYMLYKALWLALLIGFAALLIGMVAASMRARLDALAYAYIAGGGGLLLGIVVFPLYIYGFQTFIAAITFLLFSTVCALWYRQTKLAWQGLAVLTAIPASAFVWLMTAPIAAGIAGLLVPSWDRLRLLLRNRRVLGLLAAVAALTLIQPIVQVVYGTASGGFNEGGAFPALSLAAVAGIWLTLSVFMTWKAAKTFILPRLLFTCWASSFLLMLASLYFQKLTIGEPAYYTYKLAAIALVLGLIIGIGALAALLRASGLPRLQQAAVAALVLCSLPVLLGSNIGLAGYTIRDRSGLNVAHAQDVLAGKRILSDGTESAYLAQHIQHLNKQYLHSR